MDFSAKQTFNRLPPPAVRTLVHKLSPLADAQLVVIFLLALNPKGKL